MENKNNGIGLSGVLLVVFIVLKLIGVISWSWWWVLSPLWIELAIVLLLYAFFAIAEAVTIHKHKWYGGGKWKH